jgi:hypothetical protein
MNMPFADPELYRTKFDQKVTFQRTSSLQVMRATTDIMTVWPTSQGDGDPSVSKIGNPSNWPVSRVRTWQLSAKLPQLGSSQEAQESVKRTEDLFRMTQDPGRNNPGLSQDVSECRQ